MSDGGAFHDLIQVIAAATADYRSPSPRESHDWFADVRAGLIGHGVAADRAERLARNVVYASIRFADLVAEAGTAARTLIKLTEELTDAIDEETS